MANKRDLLKPELWIDVPEPVQERNFIVDAPTENVFNVLVDQEVAGYDVTETMYLIGGIWRIVASDTDDDEDVPSLLLEVTVDRRFKVNDVHAAVTKLLENLYSLEAFEDFSST